MHQMGDPNRQHAGTSVALTQACRAASLVAAAACLAIARLFVGGGAFHLAVVVVVLPLGCIWYGTEIGAIVCANADRDGDAGRRIGGLIAAVGWAGLGVMLIGIVYLAY
jgi:hypothetical protein